MGDAHGSRRRWNSLSVRGHALRRAVGEVEWLEPRRLLANIVVNTAVDETIADNATTSLREAIEQASLLGADDDITFDPEVFDSNSLNTITLTNGALEVPSGGGEITIHGIGRDTLFINADGASRVFAIEGGANLVVQDLGMGGGRSNDGRGGGIFTAGTLVLS